MTQRKDDVITFKVDPELRKALAGVSNRSEFIRGAILDALDNSCPFCGGTGMLSASQKNHWNRFMQGHALRQCRSCHSLTVVCRRTRRPQPTHPKKATHGPKKT